METQCRTGLRPGSEQDTLLDRHEEEKWLGSGLPSLQTLFTTLPLTAASKPKLSMETECPSQLLLPAITRLTSLLSGKWCFD